MQAIIILLEGVSFITNRSAAYCVGVGSESQKFGFIS